MFQKIRIASYNIYNGGVDRLDIISDVVKKINPDICGILEAVDWGTTEKQWAEEHGYTYFKVAHANTKYNIAVISKLKIKTTTIKRGFRHVVLKVVVQEKPFKDLTVFFVHLTPVSEEDRIAEVRKLATYFSKIKKSLIVGDINSLSQTDPYNHKKLLNTFQKKNIAKYGISNLQFDVTNTLESLDLIDVSKYLKKKFVPTTPTPISTDPQNIAPIRIDYAFAHKSYIEHMQNFETFKNKKSDKASDHYPIFIDIKK